MRRADLREREAELRKRAKKLVAESAGNGMWVKCCRSIEAEVQKQLDSLTEDFVSRGVAAGKCTVSVTFEDKKTDAP